MGFSARKAGARATDPTPGWSTRWTARSTTRTRSRTSPRASRSSTKDAWSPAWSCTRSWARRTWRRRTGARSPRPCAICPLTCPGGEISRCGAGCVLGARHGWIRPRSRPDSRATWRSPASTSTTSRTSSAGPPLSNGDQMDIAGEFAQAMRAVPGDVHDLLQPDAELAGEVDPRLDREDHAFLDRLCIEVGDARRFVHTEAEPVADPVDEVL